MEVAVYLFTGFLEAGKTSFIRETLADPNFNDGKRKYLVISCEDGEEELDGTLPPNVHFVSFESQDRLTPDRIAAQQKRAKADIVVIDTENEYEVKVSEFESKSKNSPYDGPLANIVFA